MKFKKFMSSHNIKSEMIHLHGVPPKKAIPMLRDLQKGSLVEAYRLLWNKGSLHSLGRFGGSNVVYVQHDDKDLPTMYFYSEVKIPKQNTLFEVEEVRN